MMNQLWNAHTFPGSYWNAREKGFITFLIPQARNSQGTIHTIKNPVVITKCLFGKIFT